MAFRLCTECLYVIKNDLLLFVLILNVGCEEEKEKFILHHSFEQFFVLCAVSKFIFVSLVHIYTDEGLDIIIMFENCPV